MVKKTTHWSKQQQKQKKTHLIGSKKQTNKEKTEMFSNVCCVCSELNNRQGEIQSCVQYVCLACSKERVMMSTDIQRDKAREYLPRLMAEVSLSIQLFSENLLQENTESRPSHHWKHNASLQRQPYKTTMVLDFRDGCC